MRLNVLHEAAAAGRTPVDIGDVLTNFGLDPDQEARAVRWWRENASDITIYAFPMRFALGVCIGPSEVCVNSKAGGDGRQRLFVLLHETGHCRHINDIYDYFGTVFKRDLHGFLRAYRIAEAHANDYAMEAMKEIGVDIDPSIRAVENMGRQVYEATLRAIDETGITDHFELAKHMVGF